MSKGYPGLTFLLCIILFASIVATSTVGIIRHVISEQAIADMVTEIDVGVLVEELEIHEMIVELVDEEIVEALGVTPETIIEFLDRDIVRDFVAESTYDLIDAIIRGQTTITISQDEILGLIREYAPFVEEEFGVVIEDRIFEEIEEFLERNEVPESITIEVPPLEEIEPQLGVYLDTLRWVLAPSTIITLAVTSFALLIGIVLLNIRRIRIALLGTGITVAFVGVLFLIAGLSVVTLISIFVDNAMHRELILGLVSQVRTAALTVGVGQLVAGFVLMVCYGAAPRS